MADFLLPDLGEGLTEAAIVNWLVAPGDVIVVDQPVVEVESAKSIVELPSPFAGRVESVNGAPGDVVQKGGVLLTVAEVAEVAEVVGAPDVVPGTAVRPDSDGGSGAVLIGYGTRESTRKLSRPAGGRFGNRPAPHEVATALAGEEPLHSPVISPLVRKQAKSHGLDASTLRGSGPGLLVTREDVDAAIAAMEHAIVPGDTRTPITGMRKIIGSRLSLSRTTIPEATIWLDVDATELFTAKARLESSTGERFSLTALIARFVVAGLMKYPVLNSSVDDERGEFVQHAAINLGLATQTARGLMVPVIPAAQDLTTRQLRDAVAALVEQAVAGNFSAGALSGGTFTLNNYGGFGVDGSTPIINHPEVAMLGVGRIIDRPWVIDGQLAVRKVVTLSFVFDHRVCDGDVASGFLTFVAHCIEEPLLLLGSL
jgi:2-oxoisovalerate dehydrogenase E2 component (dihydrolipoyl transacylase)